MKKWIVFLLISISLVLMGCKANPERKVSDVRLMPIPAELQQDVESAEFFGSYIYLHDVAAWVATDYFREKGLLEQFKSLQGWITEHLEKGVRVSFYGDSDEMLVAFFSVVVQGSRVIDESLVISERGLALTEHQLSLVRARRSAMGSSFMTCSSSYNTVVFPMDDEGTPVIKVFALAATDEPNKIMAGGHHEITVSANGDDVLSSFSFTRGCLVLDEPPKAEALVVTHLTSPTPSPIHVFLSMMHRKPLYVMTTSNRILWVVEGDNIRVLSTD